MLKAEGLLNTEANGRGGFKKLTPKRILNTVKYHIHLFKDPSVFKSDYRKTHFFQFPSTFKIVGLVKRIVMDRTIQLHNQFLLRAIKVHNVIANTVLSSKFSIPELPLSQNLPQPRFGLGGIVPQFFPETLKVFPIVQLVVHILNVLFIWESCALPFLHL
jgi:hypothetical protein